MENKLKVVCFVAREHGMNALQSLVDDPRYLITAIFTHSRNPKSQDPKRSVRDDFENYQSFSKIHHIPLYTVDSKEDKIKIDGYFEANSEIHFLVSVSWRMLVPKKHLEIPLIAPVNLHRGKLPEYAGAEPIKQALAHREGEVVITAHIMSEEIDSGEKIATTHYKIPPSVKILDENGQIETIKANISELFGPLLIKSLDILSQRHHEL